MVPVWHKYFNSCAALLFVMDVTAHDRLAEAVIELLQVLQHPDMQASCMWALYSCLQQHTCVHGRPPADRHGPEVNEKLRAMLCLFRSQGMPPDRQDKPCPMRHSLSLPGRALCFVEQPHTPSGL